MVKIFQKSVDKRKKIWYMSNIERFLHKNTKILHKNTNGVYKCLV